MGPYIFDSIPCILLSEHPLDSDIPFHTYHDSDVVYWSTQPYCTSSVSNLSGNGVDVSIVPEFRLEATRLEYAATSYGGTVDFLIVRGPSSDIGLDKYISHPVLLLIPLLFTA